MRVLVTGSSGFVGWAVASRLQSEGHEVVGLHRTPVPSPEQPEAAVIVDIRDREAVLYNLRRLEPINAVVHTAASQGAGLYSSNVATTNVLGLQNILHACSEFGFSRFVFISSLPLIGRPRFLPIKENHPAHPNTFYHATKLLGENLVRLAGDQGMSTVSLRITAPIGPRTPPGRFLATLVRRAIVNSDLELYGQGTRRQDYIDVRDIALAVSSCIFSDATGVFNIGSGESISNRQLAERCIQVLNSKSQVRHIGAPDPEDDLDWNVSIVKAQSALNFFPRYDIEDSIHAIARGR